MQDIQKGNELRWGAIFDWDGVIIDSSAQHQKSWDRMAAEDGRSLPAGYFTQAFGMKNERIIPEILNWAHDRDEVLRLAKRKEATYRSIIKEDGIQPLPGVREWLSALRDAEVPCVIGSSTCRLNIECVIDLIGLRPYFVDIVSGDDAEHGKPHPEIFLKAAERVECPPDRTVVFEDAFVGIEAARRGGMKVVAVASTNPVEALRHADRVVHAMNELTVEELSAWFTL